MDLHTLSKQDTRLSVGEHATTKQFVAVLEKESMMQESTLGRIVSCNELAASAGTSGGG